MQIKLALLGCGNIGSGFLELLKKNEAHLKEQLNLEIMICGILIQSPEKYAQHDFRDLMTTEYASLLAHKPDLVVELMGGVEPARQYVLDAISIGAHIVTANKDLLALHGYELFQAADRMGSSIGFEASVGGGIPIIKPLKNSLKNGDIYRIEGIVNGTCNYILSKMHNEGLDYDQALQQAQEAGFAESNPSSDVSGMDSTRKLCVLSSLSFDRFVKPHQVYTKGIEEITEGQMLLAKAHGMKIKLAILASEVANEIYTAVRPVLVSPKSPFYGTDNEYNAITLYGRSFGRMLLSGKGAGKSPTANAVFGDFLDYCHGKADKAIIYPGNTDFSAVSENPYPVDWILQMTEKPKPAVLGRLLQAFSDYKLNIHNVPEAEGLQLHLFKIKESELNERLKLIEEFEPDLTLNPLPYLI